MSENKKIKIRNILDAQLHAINVAIEKYLLSREDVLLVDVGDCEKFYMANIYVKHAPIKIYLEFTKEGKVIESYIEPYI